VIPPRDDDLVPASVRLGAVVPPEDPEDWTRPLTWVAALGMLGAPAIALGWFWLATPRESTVASPGTLLVAVGLAVGAAAAGGTQLGRARAIGGTLAAGLLAALLIVVAGAVTNGGATCGYVNVTCTPPTVAHAVAAALAGLAGCVPAALTAGLAAGRLSRLQRGALAGLVGALVAAAVLPNLF
jgi:hypothetical protein